MGRRMPSNCRYCNAALDMMRIIPKAEAEAKDLLKMPEEAAAQEKEPVIPEKLVTPAPQPSVEPTPGTGVPVQPGFGTGTPVQPGFGTGVPVQPGFGTGAPIQPGFGAGVPVQPGFGAGVPVQPGFGAGVPVQPGFGSGIPAQPGFGAGFPRPTPQTPPSTRECQLDFFGEKIVIPQEGGWLGRSAIGAQWFKGNLLISREHVKIVPMADGSVQVGPDKSLNGVSVTVGGVKKPLDRNETAVLSAGDILWLYNTPLQLERK